LFFKTVKLTDAGLLTGNLSYKAKNSTLDLERINPDC